MIPRWKRQIGRSVLLSIPPEFLATLLYSFIAATVSIVANEAANRSVQLSSVLAVALLDGFVYYALVFLAMKLSFQTSGYLNPAFSLGVCVVNMHSNWSGWHVVRMVSFWAVQIIGGILGVLMAVGITDQSADASAVRPQLDVPWGSALAISFVLGTFLMFVVLAVRSNEGRMTSILFCFSFIVARLLAAVAYAGPLNPARSFAHAIAAGTARAWADVWIDVIGSFLGAAVGSVCFLFWAKKWRD